MEIALASGKQLKAIRSYDRHIPSSRLADCINNNQVYVLREEHRILGILRYSLFWQAIPFLDLIYLEEACRGLGWGRRMMEYWEAEMRAMGYKYTMLSTQSDETSKFFYEKLGYRRIGAFLPPEQDAEEILYLKEFPSDSVTEKKYAEK